MTVEPKLAKGAFLAERASRRRFVSAASSPTASAYSDSPRLTTRAARPRSAIYEADFFAFSYFDGHFVRMSLPRTRPLTTVPLTTTCRPSRKSGGGLSPWETTGTTPLLPSMFFRPKRRPDAECESPETGPITAPTTDSFPACDPSWLGV